MSEYIVKAGDSLSAIATRVLGNTDSWRQFYAWNSNLPEDPTQLEVGTVLQYPSTYDEVVKELSQTTGPRTSGVSVATDDDEAPASTFMTTIQTYLKDPKVLAALALSVVAAGVLTMPKKRAANPRCNCRSNPCKHSR